MPIRRELNHNFFENWSPGMAYVLGYFAADGCMSRNKRGAHFIEFCSVDRNLLEIVQKLIGSNHKLSLRIKTKANHLQCYRLQLGSKALYNSLLKLGFTPAKSLVLKIPKIPVDMLSHFVRGYFDGDGNVSTCIYRCTARAQFRTTMLSGFTSGSRQFLVDLHVLLRKYAKISGGSLFYTQGYHLSFSVKDSLRLYRFIYKDAKDMHLSRKKIMFEKCYSLDP